MSKKIKFTSNISQAGETQQISFDAAVTIDTYQEFTTYEFKEPNMNVMNKIEVSETAVNIFAGPSSINLELNKTVAIQYQTPHGILLLNSHMSALTINEDNVKIQYSLANQEDIVGNYEIILEIS
ncbi:DUF1934 domain-containing protein [Mycoplasma marinum]|uniref:DUF1934 domain-containing protein n=1 Tax=Mycoplasma marinum TaxID=1937190 RepID=A0A4R0XLB9_9MOLU|nr:DUF1934 family protein [Mycoplasma marinum]TCG11443.1 hypothetical protein C4B24_02110 [Mycoplasma marinum]